MNASDIVAIRTHVLDHQVRELSRFLSGHFGSRVFVVCPIRAAGPNEPTDSCVFIDDQRSKELALFKPSDWEFRCGDYALYSIRATLPKAKRVWMIENDVWLNFPKASDFFAKFEDDDSDLIIGRFAPASADWFWSAKMERNGFPVMQCLFGFMRVSATAIDTLLASRRLLSRTPAATERDWPNDESFVATTLHNSGFSCRALTPAEGAVGGTYTWTRPFSFQRLKEREPDGKIYHSVRSGDAFLRKARKYLAGNPGRFDLIADDILVECGEAVAQEWRTSAQGSTSTL